jgi:hypothetical protein
MLSLTLSIMAQTPKSLMSKTMTTIEWQGAMADNSEKGATLGWE